MAELTTFPTDAAPGGLLPRIRELLDAAFDGAFSDDDWDHALGGWHAVVLSEGRPVAHAAVVPRSIGFGAGWLAAGYVEAVATSRPHRSSGFGSRVVAAVHDVLRREFEVGVLSTAAHAFYERLGWQRWLGPSFVVDGDGGRRRTVDDDDGLMVLRFGPSAALDRNGPIVCRARRGDDW